MKLTLDKLGSSLVFHLFFPKRLISFVGNVQANDMPSDEEKEYLMNVAERLLDMKPDVIIEKRLISDMTFAVRLKSFVKDINVSDSVEGDKDKNYLIQMADQLIALQVKTATDQHEIDYLKRLKLI
jgi:hypothetical protein